MFLASQASQLLFTVSWLALPRALRSTLVYLNLYPSFLLFLAFGRRWGRCWTEAPAGLITPAVLRLSHTFFTISWLALPRALRSTLVFFNFFSPFFGVSGFAGFTAILHRFVACVAQSFAIYPSLLLLFE